MHINFHIFFLHVFPGLWPPLEDSDDETMTDDGKLPLVWQLNLAEQQICEPECLQLLHEYSRLLEAPQQEIDVLWNHVRRGSLDSFGFFAAVSFFGSLVVVLAARSSSITMPTGRRCPRICSLQCWRRATDCLVPLTLHNHSHQRWALRIFQGTISVNGYWMWGFSAARFDYWMVIKVHHSWIFMFLHLWSLRGVQNGEMLLLNV